MNWRLAGDRSPRWAFMEKFVVPNFDNPRQTYLTRWRIVQTPLFGIMVHRMDGPDSRPTLHDHPWTFLSIFLKGGYMQVVRRDWRNPDRLSVVHSTKAAGRRWYLMRRGDAHYIRHLFRTPTWTLVLTGPRRQEWGYIERIGESWAWTHHLKHRHNKAFVEALEARGG